MIAAYRWKKSTRSQAEGDCIELAHDDDQAAGLGVVRDSKNPFGPLLVVDLPALTAAARSGRLDAC